jgi:hypothetical protein
VLRKSPKMLETGIDKETKSHTYDSCIVESTMQRLMRKNVLVTGASSGIGEAIAIRFAQEGANLAINYHSGEDRAEAVRVKAQEAGAGVQRAGKHVTIQAECCEGRSGDSEVRQRHRTVGFSGRTGEQLGVFRKPYRVTSWRWPISTGYLASIFEVLSSVPGRPSGTFCRGAKEG